MDAQAIAPQVSSLMGDAPVIRLEELQDLWSGYGAIYRVALEGSGPHTVVIKAVAPPDQSEHPRGWNTDTSHQRKLRSYAVERHWYLNQGTRCSDACRIPKLLAEASTEGRWLFVFEDLDAAGFPECRRHASAPEIRACIAWLASFHATFLGEVPEGLWPIGTYWHLATRPNELAAMQDDPLREAAPLIDARLNACAYQTLVHGDAKLANFCFPSEDGPVAAVDFQYVGGGCGMKDVAYFLSSCLTPDELETQAAGYLDFYFEQVRAQLDSRLPAHQLDEFEAEWRAMYAFAWADFARFLAGWSPSHWKLGRYSERMTAEALERLRSDA